MILTVFDKCINVNTIADLIPFTEGTSSKWPSMHIDCETEDRFL